MWISELAKPYRTALPRQSMMAAGVDAAGRIAVTPGQVLEQNTVPFFTPYGLSYRMPAGQEPLLLQDDGQVVCLGVKNDPGSLRPGELRLESAGGASIVLCGDGSILLNGCVTITPDGQIQTP
ncbi:hypothetical protein [Candidatus Soleaferrea massiliensis]|uniref:hypothetical protein n=1 Tax=Candidatus Soleaferrea massiliensis TaxID=1470354 RepID=UPI0006932A32|nr:hypothetical protein [Candidatus Soleaferrea massiliensis]